MYAKLRTALSRFGVAVAIVMQSIMSEELDQGLYVAARVGLEPETNEPPRPT